MPEQQIGPYTIQRPLGSGGMADVYLAWDRANRWPVALKVLRSAAAKDPRLLKRSEREAALLMKLRHPHIVQVYGAGQTGNGNYYIAMEYVSGGSLDDLSRARRGGRLPVIEVVYLMRRVAGAMAYAHDAGIVHRDLKPTNILIRADNGEPVVTDLGIAAFAGANPLTGTMESMGTPQYMAPEQVSGAQPLDGRADIYAIGVMLYEMLTGRLPFEGENTWAILMKKQQEPAPPVMAARRDLDPRLAAVVDACLQRDPAARYQTAGALAAALDAFLPADARPPAVAPPPKGPKTKGRLTPQGAAPITPVTRRRSPLPWLGVLLLLVALVAAAVFAWPLLGGGGEAIAPTAIAEVTRVQSEEGVVLPAGATTVAIVDAPLETTSTTAPPAGTSPPTATQANLPVASFVSPLDGAVWPTARPMEIVLVASDATGLKSLTLEIDGRRFSTYNVDGERLFARTLSWDAPTTAGEVVFTVWAVNVDDVRGESRSVTVAFVAAASDEPTPKATATVSATPTPRATLPGGAATSAPTSAPDTNTTATSTPTSTPGVTAGPPTTPSAITGLTTVLTFEAFGAWQVGDQKNGTLTQSSDQTHGGGFAAKLDYDFPGSGGNFVVFRQMRDIAGTPNALRLWVYGDGSGHFLNVWIMDDESQQWSVPFGRVRHTGWQQMTALIDTDQEWPWGHISGPDNGEVDYPIRFSAIVLDATDDFVGQGTIYLDDLSVGTVD